MPEIARFYGKVFDCTVLLEMQSKVYIIAA